MGRERLEGRGENRGKEGMGEVRRKVEAFGL
jgi:hypothetical protein